jgi:hypothetical protein|tara:strand:+ start:46 stop:393 length:348 start_codon:yes stop_codon:yes gene_type:complete
MDIESLKKELYQKINDIDSTIQSDLIFSFIKEKGILYSENKNGIFFNISCLTEDDVKEVHDYVSSLKKHTIELPEIAINKPSRIYRKQKVTKAIIHYENLDLNDLETLILSYSFE